jgi:Domain of unknown function (DUF4881)
VREEKSRRRKEKRSVRKMGTIRIDLTCLLFCIFPALLLTGCDNSYGFGKVEQGRVIEFDRDKRTVTFIRDESTDHRNPSYTHLPPITYELPKDPSEMGEEPKAGLRMKLDTQKNQITIFDPVSKDFKTLSYKLIAQKERVERDDIRVFDKLTGKERMFPVVDKNRKTITVYSSRQKILTTFTVPDQYLALPGKTWVAGDEVRIYYKEEGKAFRFMNVTRTDISK